jgi:hypothetical protein
MVRSAVEGRSMSRCLGGVQRREFNVVFQVGAPGDAALSYYAGALCHLLEESMPDTTVLRRAAEHAIRFYEELDHAHVAAEAGYDDLRERLAVPLPTVGEDPSRVLD